LPPSPPELHFEGLVENGQGIVAYTGIDKEAEKTYRNNPVTVKDALLIQLVFL
jgi:hypothetical protein